MAANWKSWFSQIWPNNGRAVIADYISIGQGHPHFLADIAQINHVFDPYPPSSDVLAVGIAEGRRRAALEIIKKCQLRPEELFQYIERKSEQQK
jgi:hypothetical protein